MISLLPGSHRSVASRGLLAAAAATTLLLGLAQSPAQAVGSRCVPGYAPGAIAPGGSVAGVPEFRWTEVAGADSYTMHVQRVSDEAVVASATVTGTSVWIGVPFGIDLRWKVKAENSCGAGPYSHIMTFRVA